MNLWDEVRAAAARTPDVTVLAHTAAQTFIDRVADTFVRDRTCMWWWEALDTPVVTVSYDGQGNGLAELKSLLRGAKQVKLVVTNEEPEPAGVVAGAPEAITALIADLPVFEFAVADPDLAWLIFDTHHNLLVVVGDPPSS